MMFTTSHSCPECGHDSFVADDDAVEAQRRIEDLQAQVKLLNAKAAAAVDKIADYEDEIRSLRTQCAQLQDDRRPATQDGSKSLPLPPPPPPPPPLQQQPQPQQEQRQSMVRLASLTSFLPMRRKSLVPDPHQRTPQTPQPPTPNLSSFFSSGPASTSTPNLTTPVDASKASLLSPALLAADQHGPKVQGLTLIGLQTSLENERELRQKAETNLTQAQTELEELTAQLFGQANEMVAAERKARAKLEERVKLLETRDGEKRRRLERLEKAVERIERVRRMVVEHEQETERRNEKMMIMTQNQRAPFRHGLDEVDEDEVYDEFEKKRYHEWDVHLKVWRRSQANSWTSPEFG